MESNTITTSQQTPHTQQHLQAEGPDRSHRRRKPQQHGNEIDAASESAPARRLPRDHEPVAQQSTDAQASSSSNQPNPRRMPHRPRKQPLNNEASAQVASSVGGLTPTEPSANTNQNQRRRPPKPRHNPPQSSADGQLGSDRPHTPTRTGPPGSGSNRRAKFRAKLSGADSSTAPTPSNPSERYRHRQAASIAEDLTTRLIRELSVPPYPDCPICFASIHRDQPIWSCSPSIPTILPHDAEGPPQYCWTTFHLKCIRSWASKSVKDVEDAWRARGEQGRVGDWRCPGCQGKRELVPKVYWCFCGSTPDPKPPRLSTPHSCGGPCSRPRESRCGHSCPLSCHPGPCPPCQVTTRLTCYCPRKNVIAFRCGDDQERGKGKGRNLSCGNVCGQTLGCGKHTCESICHEGECERCPVRETTKCWCGRSEKELGCGEGEDQECFAEGEVPWIGRFSCDLACERLFDCGIHRCQKACHPPSHQPAPCPRSPTRVSHCPCGKSSIAPSPNSDISNYAFPPRADCTSPIPTCDAACEKPHKQCGHACTAKCHLGPCPPCSVELTRPCRCGSSTRTLACHELYKGDTMEEVELLCDRPCTALRACGRHECRRPCCPLASVAMTSGKKGKKRFVEESQGVGEERGGLHECDLVCGKVLSCGNHKCEERDHKGMCPPCLRSSFEEMVCFCGRTIYEPPIPCGTTIYCTHPCPRPPPPCGHSRIPHACHEDPLPCPPCVHLTTKQCACGKKLVPNVRCSLEKEKVTCGSTCGKLLSCGFHHCERSCHADDCGPCSAPCGKLRKLCLPDHHPCTLACHAPSSCPETEPCQALITVTCPCGRNKQATLCGRSTSQPQGQERPSPKCTNECGVAKRNARLAEALGINPTKSAIGKNTSLGGGGGGYGGLVNTVAYSDEVTGFARINTRFLAVVEKAFADFVASNKKTQVLPHMPPERRKFVHDLATYYRIDTQLVDQEPHRSVQLVRRLDTRIPTLLLSATIQPSTTPTPNLGKLGDLKNMKSASPNSSSSHLPISSTTPSAGPSWRPKSTPSPNPGSSAATVASVPAARGWSTVVAPQPAPARTAAAALSVWGSGPAMTDSRASNVSPAPIPRNAEATSSTLPSAITIDEPVPENWEDDE